MRDGERFTSGLWAGEGVGGGKEKSVRSALIVAA